MIQTYNPPATSSMMLHRVDRLECNASPSIAGAVSLKCYNSGWEAFDLTIFTDHAEMSVELKDAINAVLAKHNRLYGQLKDEAA